MMVGTTVNSAWAVVVSLLVVVVIVLGVVVTRDKMMNTLYNPSRRYRKRNEMRHSDEGQGREYYLWPNDPAGRYSEGPDRPEGVDELVHVYHKHAHPDRRCVLYFHGNSDNITARYFMVTVCDILKLNLMLVEYRGYGKAPGTAGPYKIIEDAQTAYNFLRRTYEDADNIVVWGESLGGTPALYIASHYNIHSLILLSTFSRLDKLLPSAYGSIINGLIHYACMDMVSKTYNAEFATDVRSKTLLIHSRDDTLIPYDHAEELLGALKQSDCELVPIQGDHASPVVTASLVSKIMEYLGATPCQDDAATVTSILSRAIRPTTSMSTSYD